MALPTPIWPCRLLASKPCGYSCSMLMMIFMFNLLHACDVWILIGIDHDMLEAGGPTYLDLHFQTLTQHSIEETGTHKTRKGRKRALHFFYFSSFTLALKWTDSCMHGAGGIYILYATIYNCLCIYYMISIKSHMHSQPYMQPSNFPRL